jgi:hypothetical protein
MKYDMGFLIFAFCSVTILAIEFIVSGVFRRRAVEEISEQVIEDGNKKVDDSMLEFHENEFSDRPCFDKPRSIVINRR